MSSTSSASHLNGGGQGARKFLGRDITEEVLDGTFSGTDYPYTFADGKPHLPYVLYHAQRGKGTLWSFAMAFSLPTRSIISVGALA